MKKKRKKNIDIKIFSNIRTVKGRTVKICGFKIFEEILNGDIKIQKFIGNLLNTKKLFSPSCERKIFKILNIPLSERIIEDHTLQYNLLNIYTKKINLSEEFYKKYLKNVQYDYDDVYILYANSGESYLFFAYCVKSILRKNNSVKPLFIATQDYHVDILKMFLPDANCIYYEGLYLKLKCDKWVINNHNCYMIFSEKHIRNVEKEIYKKDIGQVHYLNSINKNLGILKKDYTKPIIKISQEVKQSLNKKIKLLNLNLDNFIILSPEAQTCEELPLSLWKNIVKELKRRDFDIFLNIVDKENEIECCKSTFLTYQEIFELGKAAKAIISLRSGLTEFLIPTETPNITIYTKFRNRKKYAYSVEKTISAFSMHKFPFVNHDLICELNINDFENDNKLSASIMENLNKMAVSEVKTV